MAHATIDAADYPLVAAYVWYLHPKRYASAILHVGRERKTKTLLMHRLILGLTEKGLCCDHINHDRLDNRRGNLRAVTVAQNNQNPGAIKHSSRYRGVCLVFTRRGLPKWRADVQLAGKSHYLGLFDSEEQADKAAAVKRAELHPFSQESRPSSSAPSPSLGDESAGTGA